MNKDEVNLALIYRKMAMRNLLLFMASDTSGKIIIMKKNFTSNLSEQINNVLNNVLFTSLE